ncbi:MAG: LemA family protein [Vulcanimicrobiota bacterium]
MDNFGMDPRNKKRKAWLIVGVILGLFLLIAGSTFVSVWNNLNRKYQAVQGARSHYSAALNTSTQKIKGVWEIAQQYLEHESETFLEISMARSNYQQAVEEYEQAKQEGADARKMTTTGANALKAALAFQVQVEAYPQLQSADVARDNIRNMEVAVNEVKTALDDWIYAIRDYNTYRGMFVPSMLGAFMGNQFPGQMEYYEGDITELDVESLNPENK